MLTPALGVRIAGRSSANAASAGHRCLRIVTAVLMPIAGVATTRVSGPRPRYIGVLLSAFSLTLSACADLQPKRIEVAPDFFRPDLDRPQTSHVAEHRKVSMSTFERPAGYYYAFWHETPGPSLAEQERVAHATVKSITPQPMTPATAAPLTQQASVGATVYPWAATPEALADPHRDTWIRHCDAQPLTKDEYLFVSKTPIPEYAEPCYPPK